MKSRRATLLVSVLLSSFTATAVVVGCGDDGDEPPPPAVVKVGTTTPPVETTVTVALDDPGRITLAEFNQLQDGMSYDQVVAIIGGPGELTYSTTAGDMKLDGYSWQGVKGASLITGNANLGFTNSFLTSRAQFGLE